MRRVLAITAAMIMIMILSVTAEAVPTKIVVRAKAKDAKFIGTSMGGAFVVIKDVETGELLAKGSTVGSTGNTNRIMIDPVKRGTQLSDDATAKFDLNIDIDEPRLVTVEVHAPYSQRQSMIKSSTQLWLIPGKHIAGDGIIIEVPGFVIDVTAPQSPDGMKLSEGKVSVAVKATITTMCGCLITPAGMWDANRYDVAATVKLDGKVIGNVPLKYAGKPSYFEGTLDLTKTGLYELDVYAYDPVSGNTGLDRTTFTVY